jgi:hypothetical protein
LRETVRVSLETAPAVLRMPFGIVHVARANRGLHSIFETQLLEWSGTTLATRDLPAPHRSSALRFGSDSVRTELLPLSRGSGEEAFREEFRTWQASTSGGTSRAVFSAFCDALAATKEPTVGGPPQLVGLKRIGAGQTLGVRFGGADHTTWSPVPRGRTKPYGPERAVRTRRRPWTPTAR